MAHHPTVRALLVSVVALSMPVGAAAQQPSTPDRPVVVTVGEGLVEAAPDVAWVTVSAESRANSPRDAQRRSAAAMAPTIEKLRAAGVPADAIRTAGYDLQQEWNIVNGQRAPHGYVARNTIDVRVDAIDRVGELLDLAVGAGATSVSGVRFDVKDRPKLEREAIRLAVVDARARADAAAAGAGRAIDSVLRIDAQPLDRPGPRVAFARADAAGAEAPPIAPGRLEVRATVTLTALLK
jgi:uncharacterized protein